MLSPKDPRDELGHYCTNNANRSSFSLRNTYINCSCVKTRATICKAFGSVNHFKLYSSLLHVGIPVMIIDVLCDW